LGHRLIDDDDRADVRSIRRREYATPLERNSKRVEVVIRNALCQDERDRLIRRPWGIPDEQAVAVRHGRRQLAGCRDADHTGNGAKAFRELVVKLHARLGAPVSCVRQLHREREKAVGVEASWGRHHRPQAARKEAGRRQQADAERDLACDEQASHPPSAAALAGASRLLAERALWIGPAN
jgi:hypothetical protein